VHCLIDSSILESLQQDLERRKPVHQNRASHPIETSVRAGIIVVLTVAASSALAQPQTSQPMVPAQQTQTPPRNSFGPVTVTLTLQDALSRAQLYEPQFRAANIAAHLAQEDTLQARAARYPAFGIRSEYLNTQGNGLLPSGRYVTNDGVHVYREWVTLHQDLSPGTLLGTGVRRASALEALARARAEIARRGLVVTVTKAYYGLITAQRKYATAQLALDQARRLLTITQDLERAGEVAHSDVIKAQIQLNTQDQALRDATVVMDTARMDLAVLLSPDFNQDFQVVDDLHLTSTLPSATEVQTLARRQNPDLQAAMQNLRGAGVDVTAARQAFMPTVMFDVVYGIEANEIGWNTVVAAATQLGRVPSGGYFLTASMTMPVWDWGSRKSRLRQAVWKREQANVELSATQRVVLRNLAAYYEEAQTARAQLDILRQTADLAADNLRLNIARYQAGEATILELVDAQTTLNQARNADADGLLRYRLALANLQTVTGPF
jgi:outer membrane protein TolC